MTLNSYVRKKKLVGILMGIALNLYITFGKIAIFTKLILPIHEHGRLFHFLRSSLISFFRDLKFFIELEREILKFIWNNKKNRIAKTTLNSKRTSRGIKEFLGSEYPRPQAVLQSNSAKNCMVLAQGQASGPME